MEVFPIPLHCVKLCQTWDPPTFPRTFLAKPGVLSPPLYQFLQMRAWPSFQMTSKSMLGKHITPLLFPLSFVYILTLFVTFLNSFLFRAKATLLDPATGQSSPQRKSPSPPRETATPAVVTEDMEDESAKVASPHQEEQDIPPPPPTKDSPHTATSVDEEVVTLGSQKVVQDQPPPLFPKFQRWR